MMGHQAGVFDLNTKFKTPANVQIPHFWQIASRGNVNLDKSCEKKKKIDLIRVASCSGFKNNRQQPNLRLVDELTVKAKL